MSDNIPQSLEEAQKAFQSAQNDLLNSSEGQTDVDESQFLSDLDKKLVGVSRLPKDSQEAIEMYREGAEHEVSEEADDQGDYEDAEYEPINDEDKKVYKDFEKEVSSDQDSRIAEYASRLEQENAYLRQLDAERQKYIQEAEERAERAEIEKDAQEEKRILISLHDALEEGDNAAHTRLTNELADLKASIHTKSMMKALLRQQQVNVPQQQTQRYAPVNPQQPYRQDINGFNAQVTPYQYSGAPQDIPPPRVSRDAPARTQRKVAAPTGGVRDKSAAKLDRDEMMIIQSMPWKGNDGKPLSFEDKKRLYLASNYGR